MERVPDALSQFIITVHPDREREKPRRFRTKSVISLSGAEPLRGRGTRVFEAVEIDDQGCKKGSNVVLKDIWVDKDRMREGTILTQILNEAGAKGDECKRQVGKYFLTTICHGDVLLDPDVIDDTEQGLMRGLRTTDRTFSLRNLMITAMTKSRSESSSDSRPESLPKTNVYGHGRGAIPYAHKTHYRIVFEECGVPIHHIRLFHDVLKILADTTEGLSFSEHLCLSVLILLCSSFTVASNIGMGTS